ncbi:hypothetical protein PybrP1_011081 [[Pythium] brassicae (nom. inval.)]|nr:hypothetical protein PybrP1_011081 [[Pythium] brassicae (nom. inval.)]
MEAKGSKDATDAVAAVHASFAKLLEEVGELWQPLSAVARVDVTQLSALQFHREFVSRSVPVVLTNAMHGSEDWARALAHWPNDAYLAEQAGDEAVTVDITPFGRGDAVLALGEAADELFVMPEEREMTLRDFLRNDSLRDELPMLYQDVPAYVELAKEAFGNEPDAVNIWIGDERAVSTMHKDHYENMYCVVKGQKHFTLLPPAAVACLYETEYPSMRYAHKDSRDTPSSDSTASSDADGCAAADEAVDMHQDATAQAEAARLTALFHAKHPQHASWRLVPSPETGATPWIPVDPLQVDSLKFPLARHLKPLECVVNAGEILYLPAMWYHRATQLCPTIAVNYWHDMDFDCKYVYYNFVHGVAAQFAAASAHG